MKKEIGFICVGQAAGNIGSCLEERGYTVAFFNTSIEDLSTLKKAKLKYHLKGGEGCNKDRDKAKAVLVDNIDDIVEKVNMMFKENFLFIIFASGGGTGSGIGPYLADILRNETLKNIGIITILPDLNESIKAHINSYMCIKELLEVEGLGSVFFLDNSKKDKFKINVTFVNLLDSFLTLKSNSIKGNLDKAEMKELLGTKGMAILSLLSKENSNEVNLIKSFHENIFAKRENDGVVKLVGLAQAKQMDVSVVGKEVGTYLDIYETFDTPYTVSYLAGLSYPFERLQQIKDIVQENKLVIEKNLKSIQKNRLEEDIDFLSNTKKEQSAHKKSSRDMLLRYAKK